MGLPAKSQLTFVDFGSLMFVIYLQNQNMENPISWFLRTAASAMKDSIKLESFPAREDPKSKTNKRLINDKLPPMANHNEMKIISPFYDRNKCTGVINCKCPFHKRLREQVPSRNIAKKKCIVSTQLSPSQKDHPEEAADKQPRMSCKPLLQTKKIKQKIMEMNRTTKAGFQALAKTEHQNEQFQKFLQSHAQWLLKRYKFIQKDPHSIKNSVRQIFHFIYKNLKEPRHVVKKYIDDLVKDRDITDYYMQRYDELQQKMKERIEDRKFQTSANNRQKLEREERQKAKKLMTEYNPKRTSFMDSNRDSRLMTRKKTHKLVVQAMIHDIQNGYEVDEAHLKKLEEQPLEVLIENCNYLKRIVGKLNEDTLVEVRDNILEKLKGRFKECEEALRVKDKKQTNKKRQNQDYPSEGLSPEELRLNEERERQEITTKRDQITKIIELINSKLDDISSDVQNNDKMSVKSRGSLISNRSLNKSNYSFKRQSAFRRETGYLKSNFKPTDQANSPENGYISEEQDGNKENEGNSDSDPLRDKGKSEKKESADEQKNHLFQLAKYRRLSHDAFFHKRLDEDSDYESSLPKMTIRDVEEIGSQLDLMENQLHQRFRTLKEIQNQIQRHHLKDLIIAEDDSLLTAKRKARAFKKILKEEGLTPEMKFYIKEYLSMIEQQNLVKNRKWAHNKFKNILLGQNNVELYGDADAEEEDLAEFITNALRDIFGLRSKLIFYNVHETEYSEFEVDFQENLFSFIRANNDKEEQKKTVFARQKSTAPRRQQKKTAVAVAEKDETLMQVGLANIVHSSYFGIEFNEGREELDPNNYDLDLMSKKREESYIKLFHRLQQLGT